MSDQHSAIPGLSVVIIAGLEEKNIRACLESVEWADEIVVVHSSHEDTTADIAAAFTGKVIFHPFEGYAAQKHFALHQATGEWVLSIDADERVTHELRDEIRNVLARQEPVDAFSVPRRNHFHGKWLKHGGWYPDRQTRLFRRNQAALSDRLVHERFLVDGTHGMLQSPLLHFTVPSVRHMLKKNLEYSRFEALEKHLRRRVGISDFLVRPPIEFLVKYVVRRGFMDGWEGFVVAVVHTLNKIQVLLQIWEMQRYPSDALKVPPGPESTHA